VQKHVSPAVSIIIASHRPASIRRCISAFGDCNNPGQRTELIVVADYEVEAFLTEYPYVKWAFVPEKGIPVKRNYGVRISQSPIIGFIDDDCRPGEGWIETGERFLRENPGVAGVEGRTEVDCPEKPGASLGQFKRLEKRGYRTNNIFYRRQAFEKAGMFDERFTVQREDIDLAFTIIETGGEIAYNRDQIVHHEYRPGEKWDLLKNCINRRFDPLLYAKHKVLYRKHVKSPFPPSIAALLASYVLSTAILFTGFFTTWIIAVNAAMILLVTIKRTRNTKTGCVQWLRELAACAASPLMLSAAVIYGSIRFRKWLFI
jgi:glycosyltransferase involved in cell wall biosynthesis